MKIFRTLPIQALAFLAAFTQPASAEPGGDSTTMYQQFSIEAPGKEWAKLKDDNRELLYSCRTTQSVDHLRRRQLSSYLNVLRIGRPIGEATKEKIGDPVDYLIFHAGNQNFAHFAVPDADICSKSLAGLHHMADGRRVNLLRMARMAANLKRKLDETHANISSEKQPFGPIAGPIQACDAPYTRALAALNEKHDVISEKVTGLEAKLREDADRWNEWADQLKASYDKCGDENPAGLGNDEEIGENNPGSDGLMPQAECSAKGEDFLWLEDEGNPGLGTCHKEVPPPILKR